jgi:hypothetical protein
LVTAVGCSGDEQGSSDTAPSQEASSTSQDPTFRSMPTGDGTIEPGAYRIPSSGWSVADFTLTFPEGWTVQYGHVFARHQDEDDELGFYAVVVDEIYTDACQGEGVPVEVGPRVDDLVAALLQQPGPQASGPLDSTLGARSATRIDVQVPQGLDLQACRLWEDGVEGLQLWYSRPADKYLVLQSGAPASVFILDIDGKRQVFVMQYTTATSNEDLAELQAVLDSIRIEA